MNEKAFRNNATASFGYRDVPAQARQGMVNEVFSAVAGRYDLMNDLMSGGLHRWWKDDVVAMLDRPRGAASWQLADVAAGTGDIALRALARGGPGCTAVLCDISPEMLSVASRRIAQAGCGDKCAVVQGNAEALPFTDKTFDAYAIGFG